MNTIINPVLRGFNPDPSILRVGEDYYIATSTFEWYPGVQIHHSRDLVHWRVAARPLDRPSQLDLIGNPDSGGVWAPALSYADGVFYLIYTDVKSRTGAFKDTPNYLATASSVEGPWSDPVHLNSSGFDPSLFHDEDGRKWLLNMIWDFRKGRNPFGGIVIQEYSAPKNRLVGPAVRIFAGTELGYTEGPHLYKRGGYYYLLTAEGGTKYEHAATLARSKFLFGPYEVHPDNPILTSLGRPELPLQKAGHASLAETPAGEWYMAHLCARPAAGRFCTLGRETALQRCRWDEDGWLRLERGDAGQGREREEGEEAGGSGASGPAVPRELVRAPDLPAYPFDPDPQRDDFDEPRLGVQWNTLRIPPSTDWLSLDERPGYLRLKGMESLSSKHRQSLIARRQQAFRCEAETEVEFEPAHFQQMAGLILYYDTEDYVYLRITHLEGAGRVLGIIRTKRGEYDELLEAEIPLPDTGPIRLKAAVERVSVRFFYTDPESDWKPVGQPVDILHLSDECAVPLRFTGTFIGLCAQDLDGTRKAADFDYFEYRELQGETDESSRSAMR
ncbi:glycoside hydrolase family 43 protein [Saccharibacillus sp. CPCC 101409]|uniref:glycoside hydrolase family 43 protein n=1 Tax=Saccharibacillus sp. CPCC 101409 TaxID=3058041 RepID=UPI002671EE73|nr:glycoside hydrolase family 43 protein [Saccharibacillus sp. CPCC 101409]MDO3408945.1 glycoside hydrolase family 43 protein [Saccharibacillus sp. CPCC 101409]